MGGLAQSIGKSVASSMTGGATAGAAGMANAAIAGAFTLGIGALLGSALSGLMGEDEEKPPEVPKEVTSPGGRTTHIKYKGKKIPARIASRKLPKKWGGGQRPIQGVSDAKQARISSLQDKLRKSWIREGMESDDMRRALDFMSPGPMRGRRGRKGYGGWGR